MNIYVYTHIKRYIPHHLVKIIFIQIHHYTITLFQPCGLVNLSVKKDVSKVVDTVDIEDISEKAVFCRCWRSKNVSFSIFLLTYINYIQE